MISAKETYNFREPTHRSHPIVLIYIYSDDKLCIYLHDGAWDVQVFACIEHIRMMEFCDI